jgi:hypothetical protein
MTDKPDSALKPCPFCGNTEYSAIESVVQLVHNEWHSEYNPGGDWWTVQCDCCTATMGQFRSPDEAIDAWNTRTPAPLASDEMVERVAKAMSDSASVYSSVLRRRVSGHLTDYDWQWLARAALAAIKETSK